MCVPITTVIGFSLLLTWIFVLYQPSRGPGMVQRMGWQAWEVVSMNEAADTKPGTTTSGNTPEGVDWWNVTESEDKVDNLSLPLDVWSPLLPHDTGRASHFISSIYSGLLTCTLYLLSF